MNFNDFNFNKKQSAREQAPEEQQLNENEAAESTTDAAAAEEKENDATAKLESQVQELNDKYLRLYAEFDNYKRRTMKERTELLQTAGKDVFETLLPTLDDIDRALKATENATDVNAVREGVKLIDNKLKNALNAKGLKEIEALNKDFDTDYHEAITKIPVADEAMKGKVVDVVEKGYTLNGKVIRFAKVVVGA